MREVEWRGGGEGVRAGEGLPVSPRVSERRGYGTFLFFLFFFFPPSPPPSRSGTVHNSRARPIPMINVINMALAASEGRASSHHPHAPTQLWLCQGANSGGILQHFKTALQPRMRKRPALCDSKKASLIRSGLPRWLIVY